VDGEDDDNVTVVVSVVEGMVVVEREASMPAGEI
jgi:hypothetical protein